MTLTTFRLALMFFETLVFFPGCYICTPGNLSHPIAHGDLRAFETVTENAFGDSLEQQAGERYGCHIKSALKGVPLDADEFVADMFRLSLIEEFANKDVPIKLKDIPIKGLRTSSGKPLPATDYRRYVLLFTAYFTPQRDDSPVIVPILENYLKAADPFLRTLAAIGLGKFDDRSIKILQDRLNNEDNPIVKLHIGISIWQLTKDSNSILDCFLKSLKSDLPNVVELAILFLGDMGPQAKKAIPELASLVQHKNPRVRAQAFYALGKMGKEARDLLPLLKDEARKRENVTNEVDCRIVLIKDRQKEIQTVSHSVRTYALHAIEKIQKDSKIPSEDR